MKSIFFTLGAFLSLFLTSCIKNTTCKNKTVESEDAEMQNYASANGITATKHSSGMYYQIVSPGSGPSPSFSSVLFVRYTGKLLNGSVFDSQTTTPVQFQLGQVIFGWQLGLPLIQKGGIIKLIIPSSLAYGCRSQGPIPANSILYFEIELVDVQ
jgi:FKBP-type peptidyl-prolyl cis-trans isomerase FkpA